MEILRNIEKNIINISNNDKYDVNDTILLKNNIKEYFTYINDKENIINEKTITSKIGLVAKSIKNFLT